MMKEFGFQWHITNYCNLRCKHCYQNDFSMKEDLDTGTVIDIIHKISDALKDCHISINITGGEPLLRKDLFDVLAVFEELNNIKEYNIITNALPLTKESIDKLERFPKFRQYKISLEDVDLQRNDAIRGRGSFSKCMENYELLKCYSEREKVFMFTLARYNYREVDAMLQFAMDNGADGVILERFVPLGTGALLREQCMKADEWFAVLKDVIAFTRAQMEPEDLLPFKAFHIPSREGEEVKGAYCNLGDEAMALMPNGDVYPCRRFPVVIGNLLRDDFKEIVCKLGAFRHDIEKRLRGKCSVCLVDDCIGCRALVYALTGNLQDEDSQCILKNSE
ncbi:MAG: hypothetical protein A2Y62_19245 [Candidatus Fischerbacteria bacterium RBG_13_37_8]|uniref:Radical SAM core domain-containing protein n=1 Tax=Candidatus Fischerbacteria bacterium RBG_13_37_8 TaxID=1817863 RepID=A0A1F5VTR9_9BACT|nr:MAG: hypothetical protein A2Y62_19245 [Candidatus Fischerbacteria bacterium RBG_13_37_8]